MKQKGYTSFLCNSACEAWHLHFRKFSFKTTCVLCKAKCISISFQNEQLKNFFFASIKVIPGSGLIWPNLGIWTPKKKPISNTIKLILVCFTILCLLCTSVSSTYKLSLNINRNAPNVFYYKSSQVILMFSSISCCPFKATVCRQEVWGKYCNYVFEILQSDWAGKAKELSLTFRQHYVSSAV